MSADWDLEQLVERWRGPLIGLLRAGGLDVGRATELAQDTFAEAWLGRERFVGDVNDERAIGSFFFVGLGLAFEESVDFLIGGPKRVVVSGNVVHRHVACGSDDGFAVCPVFFRDHFRCLFYGV